MKKNGNIVSNRRYNPKQLKPHIPVDSDEVDGAMERFIREKYQYKTLCGEGRPLPSIKHHTGSSSGSSNDIPPPLPAKTGPRLTSTLRSSSAMYTHTHDSLPSPPASDMGSNGSRRMAGIPEDGIPSRDPSFDSKLDAPRSMGFPNESRNTVIIKGANGDMTQAAQTLSRPVEGGEQIGASLERPTQAHGTSVLPTGISQPSRGQGPLNQHTQTVSPTSNPFHRAPAAPQERMSTSAQNFELSFQSMSLSPQSQTSQRSQPLFPNNTGSWTAPTAGIQNNPFLKTFTPPISPSPYQYTSAPSQQLSMNPFLRASQSQTFTSSNPFSAVQSPQQSVPLGSTMPDWAPQQLGNQNVASHVQSPTHMYSPVAMSPPHLATPQPSDSPSNNFQQQQVIQAPGVTQQSATLSNPHVQSQHQLSSIHVPQPPTQIQNQPYAYSQNQNSQPQQYPASQQPPPGLSQPGQFHDKNSILALYNTPNLYARQGSQPQIQREQLDSHVQHPQRSVTMPLMDTSSGPFVSLTPVAAQPSVASGHVSRESMAFTGGRSTSPDAFSGLSARWT